MKGLKSKRSTSGFTLTEVVVACGIAGIIFAGVFAGFGSGFLAIQFGRENLRATQVMLSRLEAVRLCTLRNSARPLGPVYCQGLLWVSLT